MRPPAPANRAELVRRANEALPAGVRISYRPRGPQGRSPRPYHVIVQGEDVAAAASMEAAIFAAVRSGGRLPLTQPAMARHG